MKLKKIGITTTVPVEVILAKGYMPIDINNIFVTDSNYQRYIDLAEKDGFPKNVCAWIKGIYGVCVDQGINDIVGVVEGDCSNTKALIEVLNSTGINTIPFSFPHSRKLQDVEKEVRRFIDCFEVSLEKVEKKRSELKPLRDLAKEVDRLTYCENKATGFENHLFQVSSSDFGGNVEEFKKNIKSAIEEISIRKAKKEKVRLAYVGVPPMTTDIYNYVESLDSRIVYNEVQREFTFPRGVLASTIFEQYQDYTYPYDIYFRVKEIKEQIKLRQIDGVIHYTQAFCYRAIEDIILKKQLDIPVLNIEGDKINSLDARTKLRIEAFLDMLMDSVLSSKERDII